MTRDDRSKGLVGAVLVVGAGVGGIQAALDLANAGFRVYLVERQPAIGGRMAQLDKTFPTNDCSMCTLAPRLVECSRHPNITIMPCAEVREVTGDIGDFTVRVRLHARYVDIDKCKGCGDCEEVCPISVKDAFNEGLSLHKAIYRPYAQAFPNAFVIDMEKCPECVECQEACLAGAIDPLMWDQDVRFRVGAIIISAGYDLFDPEKRGEYGFGLYPNVVTSLQFERMLSASGPFGGHLQRPLDGRAPHRIAFIQCVGSRDVSGGLEYCSAVCCMYTAKQALVALEHVPGAEITVFCIDVRAHGKDFERYHARALARGVRYVRSMVSSVKEMQESKNLRLRYRDADGRFREEDFDLVVLALGMVPAEGTARLASAMGVDLNRYGFVRSWELYPGLTSRAGVFAGGAVCGPRDIPETVIDAGAAAANAARVLAPVRGTRAASKQYPPERDVSGEPPRIGVFVCRCGVNIGGVVDVPAVVERARRLDGVVLAEECLFACAQDSIQHIAARIEEYGLNRVVVASCTPRTHAPLFQDSLREAGLNPYLYEHVNIREHVSWVHQLFLQEATRKAADLVAMGVAKARLLKPQAVTDIPVVKRALVVGGGLAGMTAALTIADQGFPVTLVEKEALLGGNARRLGRTLDGAEIYGFLDELIARLEYHPLVEVCTGTEVAAVKGYVGNFRSTLKCGDAEWEIDHGAAVIATGAEEYRPQEYLYGQHPDVLTQSELERRLEIGVSPDVRSVVMIQCVGSRTAERPYCSRVCCGQTVKNALRIKELSPKTEVYVLYRDMRTYGFQEQFYRAARERGVVFVRYEPDDPPVVEAGRDNLFVRVTDPVLGERLVLDADILALGTAIVPRRDSQALARLFRLPLNADGFFAEAHVKLRPVDFASDGVYLCGLAHAPKMLGESLAQAQAAAMRAVTLLSRERLQGQGNVVRVDPERCSGCGICVEVCPYKAREIAAGQKVAVVNEATCRGCGTCAAACPGGACRQEGFEDEQVYAMIEAALSG
ncbi:MAG: CoB--CoM heterodisulfide reductase iron-sulfur subunit A family protein [Bacillota bacterium]